MRFMIFFLISFSIFSHSHEWDVTKGLVRRNWALTKEIDGIKVRTMWFTSKDMCEAFKNVHYKDQKAECILY